MFFGIGLKQLGEPSFSCEDFLWSVRFKACRVRGLHEEVGAQGPPGIPQEKNTFRTRVGSFDVFEPVVALSAHLAGGEYGN